MVAVGTISLNFLTRATISTKCYINIGKHVFRFCFFPEKKELIWMVTYLTVLPKKHHMAVSVKVQSSNCAHTAYTRSKTEPHKTCESNVAENSRKVIMSLKACFCNLPKFVRLFNFRVWVHAFFQGSSRRYIYICHLPHK